MAKTKEEAMRAMDRFLADRRNEGIRTSGLGRAIEPLQAGAIAIIDNRTKTIRVYDPSLMHAVREGEIMGIVPEDAEVDDWAYLLVKARTPAALWRIKP